MKELLKAIMEEMKKKVVSNLEVVKENEADIKRLLNDPEGYEKAFNLQMRFDKNRSILSENLEYLNLQLKIVAFIDKYKYADFLKTPFQDLLKKDPANIDFFNETIEGTILFNENHPLFKDEIFINKLIEHYLEKEDYEECKRLFQIKEQLNKE